MEQQYISFELSKIACEKGFNERCEKLYNHLEELWKCHYSYVVNSDMDSGGLYTACTQTDLLNWVRKEFKLHIEIYCNASGWGYIVTKLNGTTVKEIEDDIFFDCYEIAMEEGLKQALSL